MRKYNFRIQGQNKGFYAEILFDVNVTMQGWAGRDLVVNYYAASQWELACRAGILIFLDYFSTKRGGGLEVTIHDIKWIPVDTNNLIVFYAVIAALDDALDLDIPGLAFDPSNQIFIFPDHRSLLSQNKDAHS